MSTNMCLTLLTHIKFPLLYKDFHDATPWLLNFKKYRIKFLILNFVTAPEVKTEVKERNTPNWSFRKP